MSSPLNFSLATDTSIDQLDNTARKVDTTWRAGESEGNQQKLETLIRTQQTMQFALAEVDLALKRRNGFTTKLVSEIR